MTASVTPFHYAGILTELTQALQHALQAHDWKEGVGPAGEAQPEVRQQQEIGNLRAALARVRGAYLAMERREHDVHLDVALHEQRTLEEQAPKIARVLTDADESHLPPGLRTHDAD